MDVIGHFVDRRHSLAFTIVCSLMIGAAIAEQLWLVLLLLIVGIPLVGMAEAWYEELHFWTQPLRRR